MVYVRFPISKHGINPSPQTMIDPRNLTPTQKVLFTKNRIWGNMIGGNERSGFKELKKALTGEARGQYYDLSNLKMIYPFVDDWEKQDARKMKYFERKSRIFMRGIKIGVKRSSNMDKGMSMFSTGTAKDFGEVV